MTQVVCDGEIVGELKNQSPVEIRLSGVQLSPSLRMVSFPFNDYASNPELLNRNHHIPVNADGGIVVNENGKFFEFRWYVFRVNQEDLAKLFDRPDFIPY